MARSRIITFGPGSLESVELRLWAKNRTYGAVVCAEIRGWFTVYCGAGNSHTVDISGARECVDRATFAQQTRDGYTDGASGAILAAYDLRSEDDAYAAASWLVQEYALEDWADPCADDEPDTESSVSRQHYIDTGDYLSYREVAELEANGDLLS